MNLANIHFPKYRFEQVEFRLDNVVAAVEADMFTQQQLWQAWADDVPPQFRTDSTTKNRVPWKQQSLGTLETLTYIDVGPDLGGKMPVCLSLMWVSIAGNRVLFYDQCSMITHSALTRRWLDENLPHDYCHSDAQNFHIVVHHIQRILEEKNG